MEKIILVFPTKKYEEQAKEFIEEFIEYGSEINGTGSLDHFTNNYNGWLEKIKNDLNESTVESGMVPATTYFVVRESDKRIVGMINIRHKLNTDLLNHGGHIGYGVRPSERKKGYATQILHLGLLKCKNLGIEKVLVTCYKKNIASSKVIQKNFGKIENEVIYENELLQRYWIDTKNLL